MDFDPTDQAHLIGDQYRDATNLSARIRIYDFATNPYDWFRWLFDHYDLPADARMLEVGCGPATLWQRNLDRIPPGWDITLADLSPGMLDAARETLTSAAHAFTFRLMDAQSIPDPDNSFDAVIANHMLYHVPDRHRALREIRRVLRPGGRLYASTLGVDHLREMDELVQRFDPAFPRHVERVSFLLDTGRDQLAAHFTRVSLDRYPSALEVTSADPVLDYLASDLAHRLATGPQRERMRAYLEEYIARHGSFHISTDSGLLAAWDDRQYP
jgi:ubiquinone/menaquinone biosynthesis C-methylase UbiE